MQETQSFSRSKGVWQKGKLNKNKTWKNEVKQQALSVVNKGLPFLFLSLHPLYFPVPTHTRQWGSLPSRYSELRDQRSG